VKISWIALLPLFAALAACTAPKMPDSPYPAQRAYLSVATLAERSDVAAFAPSQQTVIADAMPAGLNKESWSLVQPEETEEPDEAVIAPMDAAAKACPEIKNDMSTKRKAAKAQPRHKTKKSVVCAH
jgi:hypothetical protein